MIKNHLKVAWRALLKSKLISFINMTGLVMGLSGTLLVAAFIFDELKFDQHFKNKHRIYRITTTYENQGAVFHSAQTNANLARKLVQQFPEVENATRLMPAAESFLFSNESAFKDNIIYTDSELTNIFGLDILLGNKDECLTHPSSIIISKNTARKLFGDNWHEKQIIGETLSVANWIPLTITGVFDDLPDHTHFKSNLFASVPSGFESWMNDKSKVYTYVLLNEFSNPDTFYDKLRSGSEELFTINESGKKKLNAQSLTDIHLFSSLEDENAILGNIKNIYALILFAFFLILITVTNFANLYTARSFNRLKEVGVRKAIGALNNQLRCQFFSEAFLITAISAGIAIIAVITLLPFFNEITNKNFSFQTFINGNIFMLIGGLTISISFLASIYPLIFISGTRTTEALKGTRNKATPTIGWRKGLVILQFVVSSVMIMLSIVAFKQVNLINNKSLGFDKENTVTLANPYMLGATDKIIGLKNELLRIPGIKDVSITGYTPSQNRWGNQKITFLDRDEQSTHRQIANWLTVDEDFIETMGLTLIAGRNFLQNHDPDKEAIIINEEAVSEFMLDKNGKMPVGSELSFIDEEEGGHQNYTVVGVIKDFNFGSLHDAVKPIVMKLGYHRFEMVLRFLPAFSKQEILAQAELVWRKHLPIIPFEYSFIKDRFNRLHKADIAASKVFCAFCLITVIISVFGLFSIVTYTIANRTKEIGIRKLLGASEIRIAFILANEFIILIIFSYAVAIPIAAVLINRWLADFAYKADMSWGIQVSTGLILVFVTAITLGFQSIKAAMTNPIDNLRYE